MDKELDVHTPLQDDLAINGNGNKIIVIDTPRQIDVQFINVSYSVPQRKGKWKEILRNISGEFHSGRLTAILGPSGAGKTTLLNLLASRGARYPKNALRGNMRINGINCFENPETFRLLSVCYIPQEFALMPLLTTRETIYIAARLKLPSKSYDSSSREYIIEDVANKLGLLECMETLTSNLSGGEKKRLSIAVEMITSPSVMLLDEPTSGLDSASSTQVINLLCSMAHNGCTVVCAVHQPSSQMTFCFDDIMVMSQGRCRYCGPRENILDHFKEGGYVCPPFYNLAEFVLEVITGQRGGDYEKLCSSNQSNDTNSFDSKDCPSSLSDETTNSEIKRFAISSWEQVKILLHRAVICISRDNTMTNLRVSAHIVVAILLGIVFYNFGEDAKKVQSNIACVFFFAIFLFFANSMPAVQMFPTEATVFLRENTNNWYSLESYYVTKVLSDLPLQIICPTGFLAISYYMTGQPMELTRFFQVWLICTLFTILAQSFGILTGAAFNTHAGMFLVPALNIPMFLFAGFFLKLGEVPSFLYFMSFASYFRYVFEGILQAIYVDRLKLKCSTDFCYLRTWDKILGELDMPSVPFSTNVLAILIWIVVLHLLIYSVLRYRLYANSKR